MDKRHTPDELIDFPCLYEFKAFGSKSDDDVFISAVLDAVSQVVPVGRDAMRTRLSSSGTYLCVTVLVHLENSTQLTRIYDILRSVEGLRYLL
jgi:putative lipoic acid-binding regulatory protein